jgi:hypothetical protein
MEKMRLTETKFIPNETSVRIENYPTDITSFNQIYIPLRCNIVVKIFSDIKSGEFKIFYGGEISSY